MPRPSQRTRSRKRFYKALPGGGGRVHYKREVSALPHCFLCGQPLIGISRLSASEVHKLNRSKRRILRPYGGQLCHNCLKNALKQAVRTV